MIRIPSLLPAILLLAAFGPPCRAQDLYDDTRVRDVRITFPQQDWKSQLARNVASETDIPATLSIDGIVLDSVGVRYKGNSSYNVQGDKKPFNITTDAYRSGQEYLGYTTFNLNNFFKDPTCVREIIAYRLAAQYLPSVRTAFVRLFINDAYWGLYLHVQQPNRAFLREWFDRDEGNHYKGDPRGDLTWLGTDTARYRGNYELKTNEARNDWSDLVGFIRVLNTTPADSLATTLPRVLDVDRALWYLAFCNLLCNLDSYIGSGHNYYAYHNPADDCFAIIPWDLNEVLGTFSLQLSLTDRERLAPAYNEQNPARPLVGRLLSVPAFRARYLAHYRTMLSESFTPQYWQPRIDTYQSLIRGALEADPNKLYSMQAFADNVTRTVTVGGPIGGSVPGILSFITNRAAALSTVPDLAATQAVVIDASQEPAEPRRGEPVTVRAEVSGASVVRLYWSVNGGRFTSVPMQHGGPAWSAVIPGQKGGSAIRWYLEALTAAGTACYHPARAEQVCRSYRVSPLPAQPVAVINEVMGLNHATLPDPQGDYDDWIEIFNPGSDAVDLGGFWLSTSVLNPRKWRFPDGTILTAGGYLLVWADDDTLDTPGLHANFRIARDGEPVYLFDTDQRGNALIDSAASTVFDEDMGWARQPNGTGAFTPRIPTPGANNDAPTFVDRPSIPQPLALTVWPNPVRGTTLHVRTTGALWGGPVVLCDLRGRVIARAILPAGGAAIFDATGLASGSYLLVADAPRMPAQAVVHILH